MAIRFDPKMAFAYNNRGIAWKAKNGLDRTIAYTEAVMVNPLNRSTDDYSVRCRLFRSNDT